MSEPLITDVELQMIRDHFLERRSSLLAMKANLELDVREVAAQISSVEEIIGCTHRLSSSAAGSPK